MRGSDEFAQDTFAWLHRRRDSFRGPHRGRCGLCLRPCPGYDGGDGRRQWRALDLGTVKAVLEADAPRVSCRRHGVVVAAVPWALHGTGHTYAFDDTVAWLTVRCSKTAVRELMRVAWRTVGSIITRVSADAMARTDRFANLTRIGIDEISYKRGPPLLDCDCRSRHASVDLGCAGTGQGNPEHVLRRARPGPVRSHYPRVG